MKNFRILYFFLVIVDADRTANTCHTALFNIGGTTSTSRSWNILVTQYACGDTDSSGYVFIIYYIILSNANVQKKLVEIVFMQPNICLTTVHPPPPLGDHDESDRKVNQILLQLKVLYMSFDRFLLAFESRDLSQADKSITTVSSFPSFNF